MDRRKQRHDSKGGIKPEGKGFGLSGNHKFLIGFGERLTTPILVDKGDGPKNYPYSFEEAKVALLPRIDNVVRELDSLSAKACPNDEAVAVLTLHPSFVAKSFFPDQLLKTVGLRAIGSRSAIISPRKPVRSDQTKDVSTAEFYVAGKRLNFQRWAELVGTWQGGASEARDFTKIENI